jgi:FkbH-like protein
LPQLSFKQLKQLAARDASALAPKRVALLGDCATQFLAKAIRGRGVHDGLDLTLFEADYDQIDRQAFDPNSELYAFRPDVIVIQMTAEKLAHHFGLCAPAARETFADAQLAHFQALWSALLARTQAQLIFCNFAEIDDGIYGNAANKTRGSLRYQLRRLNLSLMDEAIQHARLSICDIASLQSLYGRERLSDRKMYYAAQLPIALELLPEVAKQVLDLVRVYDGHFKKCLVLDLDNTLWGGIIGEDGLEHIQVGELGVGRAFADIQAWAKQLQQRGVILAVCSKNDEALAKEPFLKHPDMVLRLEDIAIFVANWENKVDNLRAIREVLAIGLDAFVFLDDNPFERNMVRELLPEVCVPELPEDPTDWLDYLAKENLFEAPRGSDEDARRTQHYQLEHQRHVARTGFSTVEDYLESLEMVAVAAPFDAFQLPRVAQLTQRSNQFNLRTVRYTEPDLARLAAHEDHQTLYFSLADRFGDHGLVAATVLQRRTPDTWFIDTWLMSCRVLKRGLEAFVLGELATLARARGARWLVGEYLPTAKNGLVKTLFEDLGFAQHGEEWRLDLERFEPAPGFIRKLTSAPPVAGDDVVGEVVGGEVVVGDILAKDVGSGDANEH